MTVKTEFQIRKDLIDPLLEKTGWNLKDRTKVVEEGSDRLSGFGGSVLLVISRGVWLSRGSIMMYGARANNGPVKSHIMPISARCCSNGSV